MKYFLNFKYSIFFTVFLHFSCSDWIENSANENKTALSKDNVQIWEKLNLPDNTTAFIPYSSTLNFAYTNDGKLFKSNNNCSTWTQIFINNLNGPIRNINCFPLTIGGELICFNTDNSIFVSRSNGAQWSQSYIFSSNDLPAKINGFYQESDIIKAYGKFGDSNLYYTNNFGSFWTKSNFGLLGEIKTRSTFRYNPSFAFAVTLIGNEEIIYTLNKKRFLSKLEPGILTNTSLFIDSHQYIGTTNGIYRSDDSGKTWHNIGFQGINVKSLSTKNFSTFEYIGTDKGLYANFAECCPYSTGNNDFGPYKGASIDFQYLNSEGYLYIKTSKNEFYRGDSRNILSSTPIQTSLYSPSNNSTGLDTNMTFRWMDVEQNYSISYCLQISENSSFMDNFIIEVKWIKQNYHAINNLKSGTKFYWRVKAFSGLKTSSVSDVWNFTTK